MFHINQLVRVLAMFLMRLIGHKIFSQKIFVAVVRTPLDIFGFENFSYIFYRTLNTFLRQKHSLCQGVLEYVSVVMIGLVYHKFSCIWILFLDWNPRSPRILLELTFRAVDAGRLYFSGGTGKKKDVEFPCRPNKAYQRIMRPAQKRPSSFPTHHETSESVLRPSFQRLVTNLLPILYHLVIVLASDCHCYSTAMPKNYYHIPETESAPLKRRLGTVLRPSWDRLETFNIPAN